MKKGFILVISLLALPAVSPAQSSENTFSTEGWWHSPPEAPFSPHVHPDGSITFRFKAPGAAAVDLLFGEWDVVPRPMARNAEGDWEITIGPVTPRVYQYNFRVDGITTIDSKNPVVKAGTEVYGSVLEIPGDPPRYDERMVPGGDVHIVSYKSTPIGQIRDAYIYVPAEYHYNPDKRYPVLYLRHGGGDNEASWVRDGRAGVILDNLIRENMAVPMLVVMTNGLIDGSWAGGSSPEGMTLLEQEIVLDIIPLVESRYRVAADKDSRAIAGLSMGGGQAYIIGLRNPGLFSYIGEFSAGILADPGFDHARYLPGGLLRGIGDNYRLLWLACGTKDPRYRGHLDLVASLRREGVACEFHEGEFGHEWEFWRRQLRDFAQRLFRSE